MWNTATCSAYLTIFPSKVAPNFFLPWGGQLHMMTVLVKEDQSMMSGHRNVDMISWGNLSKGSRSAVRFHSSPGEMRDHTLEAPDWAWSPLPTKWICFWNGQRSHWLFLPPACVPLGFKYVYTERGHSGTSTGPASCIQREFAAGLGSRSCKAGRTLLHYTRNAGSGD